MLLAHDGLIFLSQECPIVRGVQRTGTAHELRASQRRLDLLPAEGVELLPVHLPPDVAVQASIFAKINGPFSSPTVGPKKRNFGQEEKGQYCRYQ